MPIDNNPLESNPYRGTRDFYPKNSIINWTDTISDQHKRNYIFSCFRKTLEANGFSEYSSSIIETQEAFLAKSGDELGSNQLYAFTDKGNRNIALRPELTLSVARMVANKLNNLRLPLRWYSIDNCFRYERPQKSRMREFWQCEVNIIGLPAGDVDLEALRLAVEIFKDFNASPEMYTIMYNHRGLLDRWVNINGWQDQQIKLFKILDDWFKVNIDTKSQSLVNLLGQASADKVINTVNQQGHDWQEYLTLAKEFPELNLILEVIPQLYPDISIIFTPAIIRGQAYYTGLIWEAFDNNKNNPRSLFGGGRFDDLLGLYGQSVPAIGFAPGEAPIHEFMENWNLYPTNSQSMETVGIMPQSSHDLTKIFSEIVPEIIKEGKTFDIDYDYHRNTDKRYEKLKKRGCGQIIKL
jgi:histidyl-tRNA synthetase